MDKKTLLYCLSILSILPFCLVTGGLASPARFLYYPLLILLRQYLNFGSLIGTGIAFNLFFPVLFFLDRQTFKIPSDILVESLSYFLAAIAAGSHSRTLRREQERYEIAISTFRSLSDDLNHKNISSRYLITKHVFTFQPRFICC